MTTQMAVWTIVGLTFGLQGCPFHVGPLPPVPDLSGTYLAHSATIQANKNAVDEIMDAFKHAEDAVHRRDLDGLMSLYAENYRHRGFTKDSVQTEWKHLFQDYHDFTSTHVFTRLVVEMGKVPPIAHITCTGSLWAISNATGERVNIDSWFGEVHYLIYENGAWRIQGHAWEVLNPKDTRYALPPHPFF